MSNPVKPDRYDVTTYDRRPRTYNPRLFDLILLRIENGELLSDICVDRDYPLPATFLLWCNEDEELRARYRSALEFGVEVNFHEATSVAFDSDTMRGNLRHKALMTRVERSMPDKYGPRATVRTTQEENNAAAGIDYGAEVRHKIGQLAERIAGETASAGSGKESAT